MQEGSGPLVGMSQQERFHFETPNWRHSANYHVKFIEALHGRS